jgi:hypothetical protein
MEKFVLLLALTTILFGGCQAYTKVEPLSFSHKDEMVRQGDFIALADRRVFATMAFMNAAGFDEESEGKQLHSVRAKVREILKGKAAANPQQFEKFKKYYQKDRLGNFVYQDFCLSLNADYPFRKIRPDSELGYPFTVQRLADFPEILNKFWEVADLNVVWVQVKPGYIEEIRKYDFAKMKHQLTFVWDYLRMKRRDNFVFISVPNLIDERNSAIGAQRENYWYMVESPGAISSSLDIHEYLHSMINPMVKASYKPYSRKLDGYLKAGQDKPLAATYRETTTYTYECLVRALDARISVLMENNPAITTLRENQVSEQTRSGLTLVGPFYKLLSEYEHSGKNFEEFLPVMLDRLPEYSR